MELLLLLGLFAAGAAAKKKQQRSAAAPAAAAPPPKPKPASTTGVGPYVPVAPAPGGPINTNPTTSVHVRPVPPEPLPPHPIDPQVFEQQRQQHGDGTGALAGVVDNGVVKGGLNALGGVIGDPALGNQIAAGVGLVGKGLDAVSVDTGATDAIALAARPQYEAQVAQIMAAQGLTYQQASAQLQATDVQLSRTAAGTRTTTHDF